jgi:hypothetical protein
MLPCCHGRQGGGCQTGSRKGRPTSLPLCRYALASPSSTLLRVAVDLRLSSTDEPWQARQGTEMLLGAVPVRCINVPS